jgi:predicted acylesterase/phospholipase RssA
VDLRAFAVDASRYDALRRLVQDPRKRVVVSFGGGGVPGISANLALAHLLELLDVRRHVTQVWGTSAGAVVGGGWASGSSAQAILDQVLRLNRRGSVDVQWRRLLAALLLRPFGRELPDGLIGAKHFARAVGAGLTATTFEACATEFRCIAVTDDGTLVRHVFRSGPLLPAIMSSMSLPGIIVPYPHEDGRTFYDGGLIEKTPLLSPIAEHARSGDGRELLLIGTHYDNEASKTAAHGFVARFVQTLYAMESVAWDYQLAQARERKDVTLLLLNPQQDEPSVFDFKRVEPVFARAFGVFADRLQNAKLAFGLGAV